MNRFIRLLSIVTIGVSVSATTSVVWADENFSLHLDPGLSQPITPPSGQLFRTGPSLTARGLVNIHPWFSVGPMVSSSYFPRAVDDGMPAAVLWQVGGAFRLQRNHDILGHDGDDDISESGVWSPYFNMDVTAANPGTAWRPAMSLQIGMDIATDTRHSFWFGPFLGYTHVFQILNLEGTQVSDLNDINFVTAGVSLTWDYPQHNQVVHDRVVEHRVVRLPGETIVTQAYDTVTTTVTKEPVFELKQHIYFDHDSSKLRWESQDKLNEVAEAVKAHPGVHVAVVGHASPDGQKVHNVKLSGERAATVLQYLMAHGISAAQLTSTAAGVDNPVGDIKTQEGLERSRRAEIEITITQ